MAKPRQARKVKKVRAEWTDIVLVCRTCAKKLKGGFGEGGDERFVKALRAALAAPPVGEHGATAMTAPRAAPEKAQPNGEAKNTDAKNARSTAAKPKKAKGRRARIGVVEVGCFDICPKDAIVTVTGSRPGTWRVIPRGLPMAEVVEVLGVGESALGTGPAPARPAEDAPPGGSL
ncbi:hypothetical protein [Ancylobacter terrae]|uniref:hypothetical protein n=1 Tax=Ancylobacter sp. sgz301288 TaxID=3342077 RepID=UPI00385EDA08